MRSSRLFLPIILLILAFAGYQIYLAATFRITGTTPATGKVAAISDRFQINFNRSLSDQGLSVSADPQIIKSTSIQGKQIILKLIAPLNVKQTYTINISQICDQKGECLRDKKIKFTARDLSINDIVKNQGVSGLPQQSKPQPNRSDISFSGFEELENRGLTSDYLTQVEQDIFIFKQTASSASIDTSTINHLHTPNDPNYTDTLSFSVVVDDSVYSARVLYNSSTVRLVLADPNNQATIFDSLNIGTSPGNSVNGKIND
jgi:hypothetical protein